MDADALLASELHRRGVAEVGELSDDEIVEIGLRYAIWLPLRTFIQTPWLAPFAVRRIRIRTDVNAPGPPRDLWGFPDSLGYFTDDNSLIKGVVRGRRVDGAASPYGQEKLSTGLVCCHVWPSTTSDPWLLSFVPNLVWLPRSLAGFSDAHFRVRDPHPLHFALRALSVERFRTDAGRSERVATAWRRLPSQAGHDSSSYGSDPAELSSADAISSAVTRRTTRVVHFLNELDGGRLPTRRVSRRYHAGVGARIDHDLPAVQSFVPLEALRSLRDELNAAVLLGAESRPT